MGVLTCKVFYSLVCLQDITADLNHLCNEFRAEIKVGQPGLARPLLLL